MPRPERLGVLAETQFGECLLEQVEFRLDLRDALELNLLLAHQLVNPVPALIQQVNEPVEFRTAHIYPACFRDAGDTMPMRTC
jgi:hypothetical protein